MDDDSIASDEETREMFELIRSHCSDAQWAEVKRLILQLFDEGVERVTTEDLVAIVTSAVISGDDTVTV